MEVPNQLSIEQQFTLQVFREQAKNLEREQAQEFLIELFRQMMVKENFYKHFMKTL